MNHDRSRDVLLVGRYVAFMLLVLACSRAVRAELVPPPGHVDARVRATPYDGDQVYRLRAYVGYQIDVEFEAGENFVGLGAGDMEGLSYFGEENHLFLKPKAANVATNLTVLTDRRRYQFDYSVAAQRPAADDPDVIFALRFIYPLAPTTTASARRIQSDLETAAAQRRNNFDYWYCGDAALRPVSASDDGVHTWLRFPASAELPAIFVRGDDGSESLLNFSMKEGDVIVHRIAARFVLRRGKLTGCIVNKGFVGGGVRLDSGTIAPTVERRVPGEVP